MSILGNPTPEHVARILCSRDDQGKLQPQLLAWIVVSGLFAVAQASGVVAYFANRGDREERGGAYSECMERLKKELGV